MYAKEVITVVQISQHLTQYGREMSHPILSLQQSPLGSSYWQFLPAIPTAQELAFNLNII